MGKQMLGRVAVLVAILAAGGIGVRYGRMQAGAQGKAIGEPAGEDDSLVVLPASAVRCEPPGTLCITPADGSTIAAPSAPVAGLRGAPPSRVGRRGVAAAGASRNDAPWEIEIQGKLAHPALAGNAIVLVADAADLQAGYMTAMRQAKVPAGNTFAARFQLSPTDGVLPGRLYRVRVVQLVDHNEVLLAQGDVQLE